MWDIIRNDNILDAIEDIIGPDILCWGSSFFTKNANDARFVSWHQDLDLLRTFRTRDAERLVCL